MASRTAASLDRLARLDSAAGHDAGELGLVRNVEDKELVCPRHRVLAGDVDDDARPAGQLDWARILALWARLAAW